MTTLAVSLIQVRSLGDGLYSMMFGIRAPRQHANQQHKSFAMKCLSCALRRQIYCFRLLSKERARRR